METFCSNRHSSEVTTQQWDTLIAMESLGTLRNLNHIGMMPDAKRLRLECERWFEDKARGIDRGTAGAAEKDRNKNIAGSGRQVLLLEPKFSLSCQQKIFVPSVEFEFLVRRSPTATFLNGTAVAVAAHKIRICNPELKVRLCKVDPEVREREIVYCIRINDAAKLC